MTVMDSHHPPEGTPEGAALVLAVVTARAARGEAVGVLRCWGQCGTVQACRALRACGDARAQEVEAARVVALVDAVAQLGADPDWD
ncbi:hypothetical protein [Pseudonocardia parietis]|uniref:Uncharacterized protein n=1 Tax=Pseudonocardia parietis TaxID=570936 RepID=A0ABS4W6W9_9PSEU|nr:hypothetical protein [Pseudonocardia parietis]MBP2371944.1 hypothetical protein [Pseudonocardia parietis]